MTRTDKEISDAVSAIAKHGMENRAITQEVERYNERVNKVASAYLQKIIDKAVELVGVTPEEIRKMQTDGNAADRKFMDSIRPKVEANAKKIAVRQQTYVDSLRKVLHRKGPAPGPSPHPPIFEILDTATNITCELPQPNQFLSAIGPYQNILRFLVDGNHQGHDPFNGTYPVVFSMYFLFSYTPPRDGVLGVYAPLIANGSNWWSTQHGCVEAKVHQSVSATLGINQPGNADGWQVINSQTVLNKDYDKHPGCGTDRGVNIVDETFQMYYQPSMPGVGYPVLGGMPLQILVVIQVISTTSQGLGQIDFFNGGQMNVPGIWLGLA
jgi:hypothetical protein